MLYQPNSNGTYPIVKPFKSGLNPTPKWTLAITESLSEQREELRAGLKSVTPPSESSLDNHLHICEVKSDLGSRKVTNL